MCGAKAKEQTADGELCAGMLAKGICARLERTKATLLSATLCYTLLRCARVAPPAARRPPPAALRRAATDILGFQSNATKNEKHGASGAAGRAW